LEIILVLSIAVFLASGLSFYFGMLFEGLRWSEKTNINGKIISFMGNQYKVTKILLKPKE